MPKKAGIVFVILGAVLILSALLLFLNNEAVNYRAGKESEVALIQLQSAVAQNTEPSPTEETVQQTESEETQSEDMVLVKIDGYNYIGYLSIPPLELELPVMADWDYVKLNIAPCRHFGSTKTDDLVIAAHNYEKHFGKLKTLEIGDEVIFTDMIGQSSHYSVVKTDILDPNAVDAVQYSGNDLVLYTCTYGGEERVAVFCDRI